MKRKIVTETPEVNTKARTTIRPCLCIHIFQNQTYGEGKRVHNMMGKGIGWRCTVCSKETKLGGLK